jgi:transposase-like protein
MSRTGPARSRLSAQEKTQIVLAVLAGEITLAEAARRHGVTPQAVGIGAAGSWRRARPAWRVNRSAGREVRLRLAGVGGIARSPR